MIDIEEKDLLDILTALTTIQGEDEELIPNYCFAMDLTTDLDCSEEEIAKFALEHGYKVFKVFSGETLMGGLVIVPSNGNIEPVKKMYNEFYGEVPEISEMSLNDDGNLVSSEELTEKKKRAKRAISVRDPNAQAMWGRTRSQTFKAKKGKGSFSRHQKHKGLSEDSNDDNGIELDDIDVKSSRVIVDTTFMNTLKSEFSAEGMEIEFETDIWVDRNYPFWYGNVANIRFGEYTIGVYTDEWSEFYTENEEDAISYVEEAEDRGIFTDSDIDDIVDEWGDFGGFFMWIEKNGTKGLSVQTDLNYDTFEYIYQALDVECVKQVIEDYEEELRNLKGDESDETLDEKKENELSKRAKKHKKTVKKGALGWFEGSHPKGATLIPNAGNVELNIAHFNNAMGSGATAQADGGTGMVGCCEEVEQDSEIELKEEKPYVYSFNTLKTYATQGYDYDKTDNNGRPSVFWYARVPESAMKVSREDYNKNTLLRKRKNKNVLNGVRKFFMEHPSAKWCVIECQDPSRHDKFLNVYRTLIEGLNEDCLDYYVVSDGKNPRRSSVFTKDGLDSAIDAAKTFNGYAEVLHYVNGEPTVVWKKEMTEDVDGIDLDVATPRRSPSGVTFEACDRELFMKKNGYWGMYPVFKCPKDGVQFFKADLDKYLLVKSAKEVLERYFKENPRRQYCVLLAYRNGQRIDAHNIFGDKMVDETLNEKVEKHETLNPKLWNEDNTLRDDVREKIMAIVKDFTDGLEKDEIKFKLKDVKLVGSNCSYNYNDASDLDVHLVMDTDSLECPDDLYPLLYSAYRSIWNKNHNIDFYGIPVEIFVETDDTEQLNDKEELDNK